MDFANYWYSSGEAGQGDGGDPGDPIGQSLRFTGQERLYRSVASSPNQNNWTISYWYKMGNPINNNNADGYHFIYANPASNTCNLYMDNFRSNPSQNYQLKTASGQIRLNDRRLSDHQGWYHVVWTYDNQQNRIYINGRLAKSQSHAVAPAAGTWQIGAGEASFSTTRSSNFEGYQTRVYYIDGQTLQPTDFGRFNENGIWVPIDYTGTYGTEGHYLDFSDPDDLGADRSGNNNHFTSENFNTAPLGLWSAQTYRNPMTSNVGNPIDPAILATEATTTDRSFNEGPGTGFNGSGSGAVLCTSGYALFRPTVPIQNVTSIVCHQYSGQGNSLNGVDLGNTTPSSGTDTQRIYDGAPITLETWGAFHRTGNNGGWWQLKVGINGGEPTDLVDASGDVYSWVKDSPTQNYSTINANIPFMEPYMTNGGNGTVISNALLSVTNPPSGGYKTHPSTIQVTQATYWEVTFDEQPSSSTASGLSYLDTMQGNISGGFWGFSTVQGSSGEWLQNGNVVNPPGSQAPIFRENDIAGFHWNGSDVLTVYKNGTQIGQIDTSDIDGHVFTNHRNYGYESFSINFGQIPFYFTPPGDYQELQSQLQPAPEIVDGRDCFQALLGPGTGTGSAAGQIYGGWLAGEDPNSGYYDGNETMRKQMFNGSTSGFAAPPVNNPNAYYEVDLSMHNLTYTTLRIYAGRSTPSANRITVNDTDITDTLNADFVALPGGKWYDITSLVPGNQLLKIRNQNGGSSNWGIHAIEIDGEILTAKNFGAWSSTGSGQVYQAEYYQKGFDGKWGGTDFTAPNHGGGQITFTFPNLDCSLGLSLFIFRQATGSRILVNGVDVSDQVGIRGPMGEWDEITGFTTLSSLTLINDGGANNPGLSAILCNGAILVDNGILASAQQTFPQGLWWIHDRTGAANPQWVDYLMGESNVYPMGNENSSVNDRNNRRAYIPPTSYSCVAHCFDASDPARTGFSITMDGTHGLGEAPFLVVNRKGWIYHPAIADFGHSLTTSAMSTLSSNISTNIENWTITDTTVSSTAGGPYYCWRYIPGYTAYGSFNGTKTDDGEYFYCGFKPAFLMVTYAGTSSGDLRRLYDNARGTYNPDNFPIRLVDNTNQSERDDGSGVEFLANGWKLKGTNYPNAGPATWTAFAENPYVGLNTVPTNPR